MNTTSPKVDIKRFGLFAIVIMAFFFLGALSLTAGKGFTDADFSKAFLTYTIFGFIGLVTIGVIVFINYFGKRKKWFVPLHNPEESVVGNFRFVKDPVLLGLSTLLVFLPVFFFYARNSQTFFTSILFVPQAVNKFGGIVGESILPAINENLLFFVPIIFLLTLTYRVSKKSVGLQNLLSIFVLPLVLSVLWVLFHSIVYGGNEVAQVSTYAFGVLWILLTILTRSFVPGAVIHFLANFSLSSYRYGLIANDTFLVFVGLVWFALLFVIWRYVVWRNGRVVVS